MPSNRSSWEKTLWCYERIRGELLKLGYWRGVHKCGPGSAPWRKPAHPTRVAPVKPSSGGGPAWSRFSWSIDVGRRRLWASLPRTRSCGGVPSATPSTLSGGGRTASPRRSGVAGALRNALPALERRSPNCFVHQGYESSYMNGPRFRRAELRPSLPAPSRSRKATYRQQRSPRSTPAQAAIPAGHDPDIAISGPAPLQRCLDDCGIIRDAVTLRHPLSLKPRLVLGEFPVPHSHAAVAAFLSHLDVPVMRRGSPAEHHSARWPRCRHQLELAPDLAIRVLARLDVDVIGTGILDNAPSQRRTHSLAAMRRATRRRG